MAGPDTRQLGVAVLATVVVLAGLPGALATTGGFAATGGLAATDELAATDGLGAGSGPVDDGRPEVASSSGAAATTVTACSFDGRDVSADNIALVNFSVDVPREPPQAGDVVEVRFVLGNVGQQPFEFDPNVGAYVRADTPSGETTFAHTAEGATLDPGEQVTVFGETELTEGAWVLQAAYRGASGEQSPGDWPICQLGVEGTPTPTATPTPTPTSTPTPTPSDDATPPTISVSHDGPLVSGTVARFNVTAEATDEGSGVVQVGIYLDGELVRTCPRPTTAAVVTPEPVPEYTCTFRQSATWITNHTYYAAAVDAAGNVGRTANFTIGEPDLPDVTPPVVEIHTPRVRETVEDSVTLSGTVSDLGTVEEVGVGLPTRFGLDELCASGSFAPDCPAGEYRFERTVSLVRGTNRIEVTATDAEGNARTASVEVVRYAPESVEAVVTATHAPVEPEPGERFAIRVDARTISNVEDRRVSGPAAIEEVRISKFGLFGGGERLQTCTRDEPASFVPCSVGVDSDADVGQYVYYATVDLVGGRTIRTAPRWVAFDRGGDVDTDGDGLTDAQERRLCTDPENPDTDRDALPDAWEVNGHRFPDGHVVDLPAMGAHPCIPDIFVEVDWWEKADGSHSHRPSRAALTMVKNAYADGPRGIRIHFDDGKYGGGEATPHYKDDGGNYYESGYEFRQRKAQHFDPHRLWSFHYVSMRDRGTASAFMHANTVKVAVRHYSSGGFVAGEIFHEFGHSIGIGHAGRRGANVREYTAGDRDAPGVWDDIVTYSGGWDSSPNRAPNYLSSMNYAPYNRVYWNATAGQFVVSLDYSREALPDLNESSLDERANSDFAQALGDVPLSPRANDDWRALTKYSCTDPSGVDYAVVTDGRQPLARSSRLPGWRTTGLPDHDPGIDWDCDGTIESDVSTNVNGGSSTRGRGRGLLVTSGANPGETMVGREDWSQIPNRAPCPSNQKDGPDGLAPSEAYVDEGHDPPCLNDAGDGSALGLPGDAAKHPGPTYDGLPVEYCDGLDNDGDGSRDEGCADHDGDGISDLVDNCPRVANADQRDGDRDFVGRACSKRLSAPDGLEAERGGDGGVTLSWSAVAGADGYVVARRADDGVLEYVGDYPATTNTTFTDADAPAGEVAYVVRALDTRTALEGRASNATVDGGGVMDVGPDSLPGVPSSLAGSVGIALALVALVVLVGLVVAVRRRRR